MHSLPILYGQVYGSEESEKAHPSEARQRDRARAIYVQEVHENVSQKGITTETLLIAYEPGGEEDDSLQYLRYGI